MAADRSYIAENDRERRRLEALESADAVIDQAVATLSDELLAKNAAAGSPIKLLGAEHRREHLDEIERALAKG